MEINNNINSCFQDLPDDKKMNLEILGKLYIEWNDKVNVISRKDIHNIYDHHILHALLLTKFIQFSPGSKILDLGTGGGIPGLPLAILFPYSHFTLLDGTGKKIKVVESICQELSIKNVSAIHARVENHNGAYDFVLCRAVARLNVLRAYCWPLITRKNFENSWRNGLIAYKGGDLTSEYEELHPSILHKEYLLDEIVDLEYYHGKKIVYLQR